MLGEAGTELDTLTREFPSVPQYAKELACVYKQLGHFEKLQYKKFPQAQKHLNQAMILCRKLVEKYPALPDYRLELADVATELTYFLAQNDPALAENLPRGCRGDIQAG